ncbi:MAG: hypothetical protein ACRDQA_27595 [Nocardioidaceae bacterium]
MSKRLSLTLERADEAAVEPFIHDTPERGALVGLTGRGNGDTLNSEAAVLRALVRIGANAVRERVLEQGYTEMAAEYRQHDAERQALRDRRIARDAARG